MLLLLIFFLKISFVLADMKDEERYHLLGRDFVTCKSQIMIPELQKLYLKDRAALYTLRKAACERWKVQDKQSVFMPRVEDNEQALGSWRWHALEFFVNSGLLSQQAVQRMRELQRSCSSETPLLEPQLSLKSSLGDYSDSLALLLVLVVVPSLQNGLGLLYEIIKAPFDWDYDSPDFS